MVRLIVIGDNAVDLQARVDTLRGAGVTVDAVALLSAGDDQLLNAAAVSVLTWKAPIINDSAASHPAREVPNYASARWARAVARVVNEESDVRTIGEWARAIGASAGALRNWCSGAGISPRKSLILSRLLRGVRRANGVPWRAEQFLDVTDPRTLAKMLEAGGLVTRTDRVTVDELLERQRLIVDDSAIAELRTALAGGASPKRTAKHVGDLVWSTPP